MNKMLFLFTICIWIFWLSGTGFAEGYQGSEAEIPARGSFLGVILNFAILLIVCTCLLYVKSIESFLKGGELSYSWQLIFVSFLMLAVVQFLNLGNSMSVFRFDSVLYSFFKLVWVIFLGWGIYRLKQVLS